MDEKLIEKNEQLYKYAKAEQQRQLTCQTQLLANTGTSLEYFPSDVVSKVEKIVDVLDRSGYANADTVGFEQRLYKMFEELHEYKVELDKETDELNSLNDLDKLLTETLSNVESLSLEQEKSGPDRQNEHRDCLARSAHLDAKISQYEGNISKIERQIAACGYQPDAGHPELAKLGKTVTELDEDVAALKGKVAEFAGLPPNVAEARRVLQEAEKELADLDSQLSGAF